MKAKTNTTIRFLWAKYQLDHVCEGLTDKQIRDILQTLPPTLYGTYDRILTLIEQQSDRVRQVVKRIIAWLANATRRLHCAELLEAIAIEDDSKSLKDLDIISNPERVIQICHNLVSLAPDGTVSFIHYSIREYFVSEHLQTIDNHALRSFFVDVEIAQVRLAKACLIYLCFEGITGDLTQLCGLGNPKVTPNHTFLEYAGVHGIYHLSSRAQDDVQIQMLFYRAFQRDLCLRLAERNLIKLSSGDEAESSFQLAAKLGLRRLLEGLIEIDPCSFSGQKERALRLASRRHYQDVIALLIRCGVHIGAASPFLGRSVGRGTRLN